MYNKKQFIEKLIEFIKSDKKIALIRGCLLYTSDAADE